MRLCHVLSTSILVWEKILPVPCCFYKIHAFSFTYKTRSVLVCYFKYSWYLCGHLFSICFVNSSVWLVYRPPLSHVAVMFQKVWHKSELKMHKVNYIYICFENWVQLKSKIQHSKPPQHDHLLPVLLPRSILLPPFSKLAFIPRRKNSLHIKKNVNFCCFFYDCPSLKLHNFKFCN